MRLSGPSWTDDYRWGYGWSNEYTLEWLKCTVLDIVAFEPNVPTPNSGGRRMQRLREKPTDPTSSWRSP